MVESMNDSSRSCGTASCGSKVAGASGCEVSTETNPLRKLLAVIWASIGIDVLACLIGVVDVREYYGFGRLMYAAVDVWFIALSAWLAIGITNRKNWARVTFIVFGLLNLFPTFLCCLVFGLELGDGSAWCRLLSNASAALTVYCIVMLFNRKVSGLFFKSTNGKKQAWAFWGVFFVCSVFTGVGSWAYGSSDEYRRDRAKAAEQGYAEAQYELGDCYGYGNGVQRDYAEAAKWYRRAAEQGHAGAQYELGVCYCNGEGAPKDMAKAVEWFRKAAELGLAEAQYSLGVCYYNGEGAPKDMAKAAEWFRKAAELGLAEAQCDIGVCYYNGEGVPKDMKEAILWLEKAKAQGNLEAIDFLAKIGSK